MPSNFLGSSFLAASRLFGFFFYFMLCNLQEMTSEYVKVHNFFVSYWFIQVKCFVNWCLGFTIAL